MPGDGLLHIANARVRRCLAPAALPGDGEQVLVDLAIRDGRIATLQPAGEVAPEAGADIIDQDGGEVWPGLIDVHSHLDKGHVWPRAENPDGTFAARWWRRTPTGATTLATAIRSNCAARRPSDRYNPA